MKGRVTALVGAQYGSEGKGVIAAELAHAFDVHVRTGGPNAGHTFMWGGEKFVARGLPVGWINPRARLLIGPGAVLDPELLIEEIKEVQFHGYDLRGRVVVDPKAHVVRKTQHQQEGGVEGRAHREIGSTGEGVGLARMARISRGVLVRDLAWGKAQTFADWAGEQEQFEDDGVVISIGDTVGMVNRWIDQGRNVLLEGTQGSGLSLTHGPWPYVTSADTNAATMAADAGIAPALVNTILVVRTFPIRVAGNSGPLEDEISFEMLGVEPETTTVTKKVRRIGGWDPELYRRAITLNRPIGVAVTFLDYLDPRVKGVEEWDGLTEYVKGWIRGLEDEYGVPVLYATAGPAGTGVIRVPMALRDPVAA